MKFKLIIPMLMFLIALTMVSATLNIQDTNFVADGNLTYTYITFDSNGLLVESTCNWELFSSGIMYAYGDGVVEIPIDDGTYTMNVYCDYNSTEGGYKSFDFVVEQNTPIIFGLEWKAPTNWTFPILYFILTIIIIALALSYESSLIGVLGSIMLMFSYFLVGATSPILFTPLLIIGFLLMFRFGTM